MKDFEDAMLDLSWKILDEENKRYRDIDSKAIGTITITGILISFLLAFSNTIVSKHPIFYYLAIFLFLIAVFFSIIVLIPRKIEALSTKKLIEDFKDNKQNSQITGIIATTGKVEKRLRKVCDDKAIMLLISVIALGIGVIFLIFYSFSAFT